MNIELHINVVNFDFSCLACDNKTNGTLSRDDFNHSDENYQRVINCINCDHQNLVMMDELIIDAKLWVGPNDSAVSKAASNQKA